jgi:uncharacterized protein YukE
VNVGGDIAGLRRVASSMAGVTAEITGSGEAVSKRVDALVGDAGWSGDAAEEFKGSWEQDAAAVVELGDCVKLAASTLSTLAAGLEAAQRQLDSAVSTALDAGVPVAADGSVPPGVYTPAVIAAMHDYSTAAQAARDAATEAREAATETLHDIVVAITGEGDLALLNEADASVLAGALRGYYGVPNEYNERALDALEEFKKDYKNKKFLKKHALDSKVKAALSQDLKAMRGDRAKLATNLEATDKLAARFKGGKLISSSLADVADSLGVLQDGGKLSKLLDGVPALDVALAGLATYAQAKDDHEKGWSWTHSILVDGGSNVAALGAGIGTDFIPFVGPFLAPVTSYGVGAVVYEAGHEGHWTEHIHSDGVLEGVGEGFVDTGKATWDTDVVGMKDKVVNDAEHPRQAASSLWQGVKSLF